MLTYTPFSMLTDEELLAHVQNDPTPTTLEVELAIRLQNTLDQLEDVDNKLLERRNNGTNTGG